MPGVEALLEELGIGDKDDEFKCEDETAPKGDWRGLPSATSTPSTAIARKSLKQVRTEVEKNMGKIPLFGRYHRYPRSLAEDYEVSSAVIGHGFNGSIKLAKSKHMTGQKFAVKTFSLVDITSTERQVLMSEVMSFMCMDHPHVARLVDVYESKKHLNLVMECLDGGELLDRVTSLGNFTEEQAAKVTRQILLAINYIHSHGIVHRDIKHSNILFEAEGSNTIKLIDFGFSKLVDADLDENKEFELVEKQVSEEEPVRNERENVAPSSQPTRLKRMTTNCGTIGYMAPEIREATDGYTSKCDLWSVGVVVYQLVTGKMPVLKNGSVTLEDADRWNDLSQTAKDFIEGLLRKLPEQRFSALDALIHPWIESHSTKHVADPSIVTALENYGNMPQVKRCLLHMLPWSLSNTERAKVSNEFLLLDEGYRGAIDLEELKNVLKRDASRMFLKLGTNGTNEIRFSDFLAAVVVTHIGIHDELLRASFKRFDIDSTGRISSDNIRLLLGDTYEGKPVEQLLSDMAKLGDDGITFEIFAGCIRGTLKLDGEDKQVKAAKMPCCVAQ